LGAFRAVIFDMDGVLADTEPVYLAGINEVLKGFGLQLSTGDNKDLIGTTVEFTWDAVIKKFRLSQSRAELVARYDAVMEKLLSEPRPTLPGVRPLLDELRRRRTPYALASSSWPNWIAALLGATGLNGSFDVIVSVTMVEHGKPAPDIFLYTAGRLAVKPEQCLVLEDTPSGIAATKAAGMYAVQMRGASTAFPPLPNADLALDSLEDFPFALLDSAVS
jgi:HAD superfamily hydrolase (TIGR01509 family)